ncbi:hypothetical protein AVEN_229259-1 [Araneus ventricosus]|uniref:CCHC-type domain-containing protein n=1 Tax=Araneus ventricosus TaxID=182803 RepID=A0A4Y2TJA0_ARAVE|nr:hypothetical protein AVEN_229259-1 [Araneus ventricosus]
MVSTEAGKEHRRWLIPLVGLRGGCAVEPESLPLSYGFFVFRHRNQFIYSLHVDTGAVKISKSRYFNCKILPYIPNPLRCFNCQRYGHSQQLCQGTEPVCGKCAESGHEINVCNTDTLKCRNCSGPHAASSKSCPT